ncbi:MAG: endonuclease MutS2 [Planctomycetota bacterium]|jgi:DNA mismatch repair protein MutS2
MARKRIDEHTLRVLEFDEVRQILASFASSTLGRDAAKALYPSVDASWVNERMSETSELKGLLERGIRIPLAGLRDIRDLLTQFGKKRTVFEPGELLEISDTLTASGRLKRFFSGPEANNAEYLRAMGAKLQDYGAIVDEINRCIDGDKMVRDEASEKLKEIRRRIDQLGKEIRRRFKAIVASPELRKAIENDKFLTRHDRPVVAIKTRYRNLLRGTVLDRSNTGATVYIEPDSLVELSNELEDVLFAEKKEVGRILWVLSKDVLNERKSILDSVRMLGLIDLTYAKAGFSMAYNMAAPTISSESFLRLRDARHPLLVRWTSAHRDCDVSEAINEVVPIDLRLGDDFDLLLVTGPNTGGKTVMLKTIGVLTLMTQSGMHIPARADSQIPVYRQVYADIGDEQSIEQSLSTFSAHMQQIVRILTRADKETLTLLDELGAGTDPVEGAVLATAILNKLLKKSGHVVATTHLGQLKAYAYTTARVENASVEFDTNTLKPTYRVMIGTPGSSNAVAIAQRLGMPKAVTNEAKAILAKEADGSSELINRIQTTRQTAEQKRSQAEAMLDEAEGIRTHARRELKSAKEEGRRLKNMADRQIDESMGQVRQLAEGFLAQMRNAPKPWSELADELAQEISNAATTTPLAVRHAKFIEGLSAGDGVFVIPFKRSGIVHRIRRKRRTMVVFVEGKQVEVPFSEVCELDNTGRD